VASAGTIQQRYRRLLSFGDVLDESMFLFRKHWVTFALVSAVSLLPPGLVLVALSAGGVLYRSFSLADLQSGRLSDPAAVSAQIAQVAAGFAYAVVSFFFGLLWTGAVVATTDAYVRGEEPRLKHVYTRAGARYLPLLASSILVGLAICALALAGSVLVLVTLLFVGSLVALVGLLVWWLQPGARRPWLKWLIILAAPWGLPAYYATRWAMFVAAVVLEERGPIEAMSRSSQLTDGHWFRVAAILTVAALIVGTMLTMIDLLVTIPLTVVEAIRGRIGLDPTEAALSSAVTLVVRILLTSIGTIVYTLLFIDLRNRHEATDIVERVSQLETAQTSARG
jgi:hypothetical protein